MKKLFVLLVVFLAAFVLSIDSQAGLVDRGCGLIYDTDYNITWLQDARFSRPEADAIELGGGGGWGVGFMGWFEAKDWADALQYKDECVRNNAKTGTVTGGADTPYYWDDWRLPNAENRCPGGIGGPSSCDIGPCIGYDCTGGEMGHLYYTELGNTHEGGLENTCFTDAVSGSEVCFQNLAGYRYWYGWPENTYPFWEFSFYNGYQGLADCHLPWPVRNGDVGALVPPAAPEPDETEQEEVTEPEPENDSNTGDSNLNTRFRGRKFRIGRR